MVSFFETNKKKGEIKELLKRLLIIAITMLSKKNIAIGLVAIIIIFVLIYSLPTYFQENASEQCVVNGECQHELQYESLTTLIPIFLGIGFIIGVGAFYFLYKGETTVKKLKPETLLPLLNKDERKIISKLIDRKGEAIQTELSKIEGLGKVKVHRIVKKLEKRGAVEIEAHGKTNLIKLKKEIRDLI